MESCYINIRSPIFFRKFVVILSVFAKPTNVYLGSRCPLRHSSILWYTNTLYYRYTCHKLRIHFHGREFVAKRKCCALNRISGYYILASFSYGRKHHLILYFLPYSRSITLWFSLLFYAPPLFRLLNHKFIIYGLPSFSPSLSLSLFLYPMHILFLAFLFVRRTKWNWIYVYHSFHSSCVCLTYSYQVCRLLVCSTLFFFSFEKIGTW